MTPNELARHLRTLQIAVDSCLPDTPETVEGLGDAYVKLDANSDTPFPSTNRNCVQYLGCTATVAEADVRRIVELFSSAGCQRFFFWLSPGPQDAEIRTWLSDNGLTRFGGTGYPTLLRPASAVPPHDTQLEIRRIDPQEAEDRAARIEELYGEPPNENLVSVASARSDFDHYGAYADGDLVGVATMCRSGDVGHLGWAIVDEEHRRRGGQGALITARINRAFESGCRWVSSETLYLLETSLGNLRRNGFEIGYEKEVYEWVRP